MMNLFVSETNNFRAVRLPLYISTTLRKDTAQVTLKAEIEGLQTEALKLTKSAGALGTAEKMEEILSAIKTAQDKLEAVRTLPEYKFEWDESDKVLKTAYNAATTDAMRASAFVAWFHTRGFESVNGTDVMPIVKFMGGGNRSGQKNRALGNDWTNEVRPFNYNLFYSYLVDLFLAKGAVKVEVPEVLHEYYVQKVEAAKARHAKKRAKKNA